MKKAGEKSALEPEDEILNAALTHSPDSGYWIFDLGCLLCIVSMCAIRKRIRQRQRAKNESASEPKPEGN